MSDVLYKNNAKVMKYLHVIAERGLIRQLFIVSARNYVNTCACAYCTMSIVNLYTSVEKTVSHVL